MWICLPLPYMPELNWLRKRGYSRVLSCVPLCRYEFRRGRPPPTTEREGRKYNLQNRMAADLVETVLVFISHQDLWDTSMSNRRSIDSSQMPPLNINSWIRVWFLCATVVVWYECLWMSPSHTILNIFLNENLRKDSGTRYVILYNICIRNL